ncbi:hypothetical protein N1029_15830 [Herbiconiux sp. CPCC 203406]|uniref:DUF6994 family protein n=1 Tax=Herbiconiux oxytropis TaxID=2970915 RepID=UPI00217E47D2|nr:hypothetical protein [Herbiconiux oxytropis]MCS5723469.1 hypothetical protein [Herbiconiux oxytropis]
MSERLAIDVTLDMRADASGKDPDKYSSTLRRYHQALWSKPLPTGSRFDLDASKPGRYLYHQSALGEFLLASDSILRTFNSHPRTARIVAQIPMTERDASMSEAYTIGGMIVFPGNRIDGKQTINQARGTHPRVSDRFDLTVECIRRHYLGQPSPLDATLNRYAEFFALFESFRGYVDFFLLPDAVTDDYSSVRFWAPFDDFTTPAIPQSLEAYVTYRDAMFGFLRERNSRISAQAG